MITDNPQAPSIQCPPPGIYENIPFNDYLAMPALDPTAIASGLVSMLQFHHDRQHPKAPTDAMIFGTAVHTSILEPDLFPLRYVIWTGGRRAGKEWDAFEAANTDKTILKADEYAACLGCRNSVHAHPAARPILLAKDARREVSVFWINGQTGLLCKGRVDILSIATADLKTTRAKVADDRALKRIASDLLYDMRMGAYHEGLSAHLGLGNVPPVKIIFVEQGAPFDVRVKTISQDSLAHGWDKWQEVLGRIAECEKSGVWPGCDDGESELEFWGGDDLEITLDGEAIAP